MLLSIERFSTSDIITAKPRSLFLSIDQRLVLMWIAELDKKPHAIFLNGPGAGSGVEIGNQAGGYGLQFESVQIRANPASGAQNGRGWNLQASNDVLSIGFHKDGIGGQLWAPVADLKTATKSIAYFSDWSAGVEAGGEWVEIISSSRHDDLKVNADLTTPVG